MDHRWSLTFAAVCLALGLTMTSADAGPFDPLQRATMDRGQDSNQLRHEIQGWFEEQFGGRRRVCWCEKAGRCWIKCCRVVGGKVWPCNRACFRNDQCVSPLVKPPRRR
jgi:hypothetical protein